MTGAAGRLQHEIPVSAPSTGEERSRFNDWLDLIRALNPDGERWVTDFEALGYRNLMDQATRALNLFHQKRLEEGRGILEDVLGKLEAKATEDRARETTSAMLEVIQRVYWGVLAYFHYARKEYVAAESCLDQAQEAVERAIAGHTCVLPLANHCHEFLLHKVRISRNRKNWREMDERIAQARQVVENRLPLCIPTGQKPLYYEDLAARLLAIPALTAADRQYLNPITDGTTRMAAFENFVGGIRLIPGMVIAYP